MKLSLRKQQALWGYIFYSPWIVGVVLLFAWPLLRSLLLSFQKVTNLANLEVEWVGLENYRSAITGDVEFLPALLQGVTNLAIQLPLILVMSLSLALLMARVNRGQTLLRAVFFLPVVIGSANVIKEMIRAGADDAIMASLTASLRPLTGTLTTADPTQTQGLIGPVQWVVERLTLVTWHTGVQILLFIGGINSIPPSLYEAAYVDGATGWEAFWKITLPMLSPVILVTAVYTVVDSFTDPLNPTVAYVTNTAFGNLLRLEFGAALAWIYFVVMFIAIVLLVRGSRSFVFYAGERQ